MLQVRFTRQGRIAFFLTVILELSGITSGANLLIFLAALLGATLIFSWLISAQYSRRLHLNLHTPGSVVRTETFIMNLKVRVTGKNPIPPFLLKFLFTNTQDQLQIRLPGPSPKVPLTRHVSHQLQKRGRIRQLICQTSLGWPSGLIHIQRSFKCPLNLAVYPFPLPVDLKLSALKLRGSLPPSDYITTHSKGYGGLFYGVREYQSGDALRFIHWPLTARHGNLMIKEYEDTGHVFLTTIILDNRAEVFPDAIGPLIFERMVDATAGLLKFFTDHRYPVSIFLHSGEGLAFYEGMDAATNLKDGMQFLVDAHTTPTQSRKILDPCLPLAYQNDLWMLIRPHNTEPDLSCLRTHPAHLLDVPIDPEQATHDIRPFKSQKWLGKLGISK